MTELTNEIEMDENTVNDREAASHASTVYTSLDASGLAKETGIVEVYNYHAVTGEFAGKSMEHVMVGVGIPGNSTCEAPPDAVEGKVCIYDKGWKLCSDHRGETVYSTEDGSPVFVSQTGDYPTGTTPIKPATEFDKWDGAQWVTDQVTQKAALVKAANAEKTLRISEANSVTQAWQTQLLLGIISDEDKATLTDWMKYIQLVQAVKTSSAPDITWPDKP